MKIWHLSNVQMLSWRNRSWKIRCFRLEMLFQKWWYPISSFAHSVSTDLAIFLVSVYRRVCWILKVFRVCNFFSQQSGKLAKFLMPLCIIKIFSEHGFDSEQIQKYFNEIVKLFIPRKVTVMSLINGYITYTHLLFSRKKNPPYTFNYFSIYLSPCWSPLFFFSSNLKSARTEKKNSVSL